MADSRSNTKLICSIASPSVAGMRHDIASAVAAGAEMIELRFDLLDATITDDQLAELIAASPVDVLVTDRPVRQGGRCDGNEAVRLSRLARAPQLGAAWVDVESDVPPADRPDAATILSYHNFETCPDDLADIAAELDASSAAVNKLAVTAAGPEDALRMLDLVRDARKPTLALAMGEAGLPSRILGKKFGAFGTFAALSAETAAAPGQPTVDQLKGLYRWDAIGPDTQCFGVIGCPVAHSMSPAIHNAAFTAAGIDGVYVPLLIQPGGENFNAFLDALLARSWMDWRGLSVTIPHKENALSYVGVDRCDDLAVRIGAVNTITVDADGALAGDNTDYAAAIDALCEAMGIERTGLAGRAIAVLGAGGASRAIVAALAHYGAEVTIYNRTLSRAESLAAEFGASARPIAAADDLEAEIIINCTPIGMHSHSDASPLSRIPSGVQAVFDTIYNPVRTALLTQAEHAGCLTVSGLDMFVNQAAAQFERWTAKTAPRDVMRQAVLDQLGIGTGDGKP
jgi:3-dehydroquinate dehydratase/shikimate dehydrogenase